MLIYVLSISYIDILVILCCSLNRKATKTQYSIQRDLHKEKCLNATKEK